VLRVPDTRLALGALARAWRREVAPTTVAITGSVGKTTTKELTRAVLARAGATHATGGNLNNEIGLPLTILAMPERTRFLCAEMGMSAPGEIAYLCSIAEPELGLITAIAPVHLEGLGSLEGIAAAKAELLERLPPTGHAITPSDAPLLDPHLARARVASDRRLRFGDRPGDQVRLLEATSRGAAGSDLRLALGSEEIAFRLPLVGAHNARNAAAAAAVGLALGVPGPEIAAALSEPPPLKHRSVLRALGAWQVFDDCYNASPVAAKAALDTLVDLAGSAPTVAVLGSMLELGPEAPRFHRELGAHLAARGVGLLIAVGAELARAIQEGALAAGLAPERALLAASPEQGARLLAERVADGAWVLVKASRGARLEGVLTELERLAARRTPRSEEGSGR
jgi:UDP-N-acetylmuramoyl-tripeptide--D-alanyl-D-alanine ligase